MWPNFVNRPRYWLLVRIDSRRLSTGLAKSVGFWTLLTGRDIVRLSARMGPDAAEPDAKRGAATRETVESNTRPRCASGSACLTQHLHLNPSNAAIMQAPIDSSFRVERGVSNCALLGRCAKKRMNSTTGQLQLLNGLGPYVWRSSNSPAETNKAVRVLIPERPCR